MGKIKDLILGSPKESANAIYGGDGPPKDAMETAEKLEATPVKDIINTTRSGISKLLHFPLELLKGIAKPVVALVAAPIQLATHAATNLMNVSQIPAGAYMTITEKLKKAIAWPAAKMKKFKEKAEISGGHSSHA